MFDVREEQTGDHAAVRDVNTVAFESDVEAAIVDALRPLVSPQISLVAVAGDAVVGHIYFSPVTVGGSEAIALGPMAVTPAWQRRGVGSALVREGLARCRTIDRPLVFVLGHPEFYPRFGFEPAWPRGFWFGEQRECPAFFVAELDPGVAEGLSGEVVYHPEFMNAETNDAWQREIVELHEFFEAWLGGTVPDTDEAYSRFAGVLDHDFTYLGPDGVLLERASLLGGLRKAHGSQPGLRIEIRNPRLISATADLTVAAYEEWQTGDGSSWSARRSTVVFVSGTVWRHVHETWMDVQMDAPAQH
jgi:putative acetyltransferase